MKTNEERLTCVSCVNWSYKDSIGYCSVHRDTRASSSYICSSYKPKAPEGVRLLCKDCAHWSFKDYVGYCSVLRSPMYTSNPICSSFKPKVTEPETEQTENYRLLPYLGAPRSKRITEAIMRFLTGDCSHGKFVSRLWRCGFLHSAAEDLADAIVQFRKQKPEPMKIHGQPFPAHWRAWLDMLRDLYMQDFVDMDVVLAALDPSRSESNVVCDLVSVWEGEKERLRSGKNHLDYLRDMIDIHKPPEQMYGSLEDHKKLSEMYGARRCNKDGELTVEDSDPLEDYMNWPTHEDDDDA